MKTASARRASLLQQVRDSGLPDALAGRVAVHEALTVYEVSWQEDWDNCGWRTMLAARRHQLATVHCAGTPEAGGVVSSGHEPRSCTRRRKRARYDRPTEADDLVLHVGRNVRERRIPRRPPPPRTVLADLGLGCTVGSAPATANPAGTMTTKRRRARRASCARERRRPRRRTEQSVSAGRTSRTEH